MTAERRTLVRQSQQVLGQMSIESVLLYSRVQKSPSGTGVMSFVCISVTSLQRMLRKDLNKFPYKVSTCHKLTDTGKQRPEMCNRVAERMDRFRNGIGKVWFTNESHFHLNDAVNYRNNVYWRDERPKEIDERCLKDPKMAALCAINAKKGMLGPDWFEDSRARTVIVNGERYKKTLNKINEDFNQLYTPNQRDCGSSTMVQLSI